MYKYPVIVFEGIETSGKSTNIKKVSSYLNNIKYSKLASKRYSLKQGKLSILT